MVVVLVMILVDVAAWDMVAAAVAAVMAVVLGVVVVGS